MPGQEGSPSDQITSWSCSFSIQALLRLKQCQQSSDANSKQSFCPASDPTASHFWVRALFPFSSLPVRLTPTASIWLQWVALIKLSCFYDQQVKFLSYNWHFHSYCVFLIGLRLDQGRSFTGAASKGTQPGPGAWSLLVWCERHLRLGGSHRVVFHSPLLASAQIQFFLTESC